MYTNWSDINLAHATVRVSHKPDRGWTPKAYKEREIPIPAKLVNSLKVEGKVGQDLQPCVPDRGLQSEAQFSRLP